MHGPAWRWLIVCEVLDPIDTLDSMPHDPLIRRLVRVLRLSASERSLTPSDHQFLADFQIARAIYVDARRRLELEARVLANQQPSDIAPVMSTTEQVIKTYEEYFFPIREQLGANEFIANHVLDDTKFKHDHLRNFVLSSAYFGGIHTAEYMLKSIDQLGQPHDLATVQGRNLEMIELMVLTRKIAREAAPEAATYTQRVHRAASDLPPVLPTLADIIQRRIISTMRAIADDQETQDETVAKQRTARAKKAENAA